MSINHYVGEMGGVQTLLHLNIMAGLERRTTGLAVSALPYLAAQVDYSVSGCTNPTGLINKTLSDLNSNACLKGPPFSKCNLKFCTT